MLGSVPGVGAGPGVGVGPGVGAGPGRLSTARSLPMDAVGFMSPTKQSRKAFWAARAAAAPREIRHSR